MNEERANEEFRDRKERGFSIGTLKRDFNPFSRLSAQDKINFARHLAIVIKAGIPLYEGLVIINKQSDSKTLTRIVAQIQKDVANGRFLADSLERFTGVFGDFFINIIRVGEASGTLAQNLLYLADELKKRKGLRAKVRSAMVYPVVILVATIGVTGFLTFFVFPKLLPVLQGLNVKLPPSTVALIAVVDFLTLYGIEVIIGLAILIICLRILTTKVASIRYAFHRAMLGTPALSKFSISLNVVSFSRILALLLKSGVKIVDALGITALTSDNLVYRNIVQEADEEVRKGGQLAPFLAKYPKFFPPLMTGMIQIGESTGNLTENLEYLSAYYEEEMSYKLESLTGLLEPALLLMMGLLVGFVAISIITPIYSISQGVQ
ncbi:MAG: type II secretion system F family protein [Candidatus Liptonbacteria bacterium]|nr:type II secretion system F family protein [Candidatus Liptonbacteria bacterium]